jgi:hypothetical protein
MIRYLHISANPARATIHEANVLQRTIVLQTGIPPTTAEHFSPPKEEFL